MDKISILEKKILKHKDLYYQGKPEISDFEFDALEEELKTLDPNNEILQIIGASFQGEQKVEHDQKMLSLNKTYKLDELLKWGEGKEVVSTFKIDGSSCSLIYENGKLQIGKTRGNGKVGENITRKVLFIPSIPKAIQDLEKKEIRGEVYCTEENFFKLSKEMETLGLEKPTNMRNIVAGLLGRKENIELCEYLSFQAFELIQDEKNLNTEIKKFELLKTYNFITPDFSLNIAPEDYSKQLEVSREFMSDGNYLIDGLVFSFNDLSLHQSMGETAHHPRYKMAFKFQGETKETVLKDIVWQVSRNGILTPVAIVEPVELSGAMVGRVTLHNFGVVKQNNLKIGDKIEVVRSGEVIPKFLNVIKESSNRFIVPEVCPSCGEVVREEEIRLICDNFKCPDKVKDEILNFIQKIGIDDLSSKRLEELIKAKLIFDIPSLYTLTKEQLLSMDKIKDKLSDKILGSIETSKEVDLITFLSALGISGGAYNKCEKIVLNGYDTIEKIIKLRPSQLELIDSFAEKSSADFVDSLNSKKEIINKLITYGFKFKAQIARLEPTSISGKKFCITGTLSMKRSELQKMVKSNGGIVQSGVSKDTDYLITNDVESSSSKFKKAKSLEIPIINEEKFFKLLE